MDNFRDSNKFRQWKKRIQNEVKAMIMQGKLPTRATKVQHSNFASTARHYYGNLITLLGLVQEEYIKAGLVVGRLKVKQFFSYKQEGFLELPQSIFHMLDKLESGNAKKHSFCGYRQLLDSLYIFLSRPEGIVSNSFMYRFIF